MQTLVHMFIYKSKLHLTTGYQARVAMFVVSRYAEVVLVGAVGTLYQYSS